jgi:hypothetical protein
MSDRGPLTQDSQEIINELLAMGVRFLNRIEFRAEAEPETMPEMAALYDRVSRSVRRSIALRHHLDQAPSRTQQRTAGRRKIIRTVEDAIDLRAETPEQAERLTAELHKRRTPGEVAELCARASGRSDWNEAKPESAAQRCVAAEPSRATNAPSDFLNHPERFFRNVLSLDGAHKSA